MAQDELRRGPPRWLTVIALLVPAVAFIGLLAFASSGQGPPAPGDPAPAFAAPVLGGGAEVALGELQGRPVFVNFWWSGCAPCRAEAPSLKDAHEAYGGRVQFLGINIRDREAEAEAFVEKYGLDYLHVRDEGLRIYDDYGLTGQPESFFIDADGVIVDHVAGPLSHEGLLQRLDSLVAADG